VLALWAQHFGIAGVGIDIRPYACERAQRKMREHGFARQIEIVCMNGAEYAFEPHTFAVAACLGATFIFEGFRPTLRRLQEAIHPDGQLVVGEAHWLTTRAPPEFAKTQPEFYQEAEVLEHLYSSQDEYLRYGRAYLGWAMYVLQAIRA
jgi:ubiquinone/menaquinone biosynthesis C-methylase UbiE